MGVAFGIELRGDEECADFLRRKPEVNFVKFVDVARRFKANIHGLCVALSGTANEGCGGLDASGSPHGDEHRAVLNEPVDTVELVRFFAKPAHVRAEGLVAVGAAVEGLARRVGGEVFEGFAAAERAAAFEEFAVQMDHVLRACAFVERVHVLCDDVDGARQPALPRGQGVVGFVGNGGFCSAPTLRVEIPHEPWVFLPAARACDIGDVLIAPVAASVAERGDATFGAYTGACKNEDRVV